MSHSIENPETLLAHDRFVRALAQDLLADVHRAEDVAQDTWLALAVRPHRGLAPLRAWLTGIVKKLAACSNRADRRRLRREQVAARPEALLAVDQVLEREALRKGVVDAVLALAEPYRTTILLRFFEELPPRMVAARMRTPVQTVHTRIKRGLEQLRAQLEEAHGAGGGGWRAALLPLGAGPTLDLFAPALSVSASSLAGAGVFLVSTTMKWLAALGLVAALGLGTLWAVGTWDAPSGAARPDQDVAVARASAIVPDSRAEAVAPRAQLPETAAPTSPPSPTDLLALTGRVLAEAGAPVLGARVEVRKKPAESFWLNDLEYAHVKEKVAECATDRAGRFSFVLPRARAFELHVRAAGFAPEVVTACYAGQQVTIRLQRGAIMEGGVTAAGTHAAIAGATLRGWRADGVDILRGVSGEDGRFSFPDLSACTFTLEVLPPEGMAPRRQNLTLSSGRVLRHDVEIERGGTVKGKVTDALTGLPIAHAEVAEGWTFRRVVRTDVRGDYVVQGFPCPGITDLHVRAAGYGRQAKEVGEPTREEKVVDFQLDPAGSARGRILDADGKPMARIYAAGVGSEFLPVSQKSDWQSARTKADGTFLLENLRTDLRYALFVRHEGFGTLAYDFPAPAKSGEVLVLGDVTLLPAGCLEGRIVDQVGRGLSAIRVELIGTNSDRLRFLGVPTQTRPTNQRLGGAGDPFVGSRNATTDTEGLFRFADLAEGEYGLMVSVLGLPNVSKSGIQVRSGKVVADVLLVIDLQLSVRGRVVTPSGELPGKVVVILEPERALPQPPGDEPERDRSDLAGPEGEFDFKGVKPGTYAVTAMPILSEGEPKWVEGRLGGVAAGSAGVEVLLKRITWVEGTVLDASGNPAAGAAVSAGRQDGGKVVGPFADARCGNDGRFRISVGEGDIVEIRAGRPLPPAPGSMVASIDPRRSATLSGVRAGTKDVVIRLP